MRDVKALQRRRRLLLRQSSVTSPSDNASSFAGSDPHASASGHPPLVHHAVDPDAARRQLFEDCQGRLGLKLIIEVTGEAHHRKVSLDQPFVVLGSDRSCDVQIEHPAVLPCHAYLQWIDGRVYCCGLGVSDSQSPVVSTWVDRKPVTLGPIRISVPDMEPHPDGASDPQSRSASLAAEVPQVQLKFEGVDQRDNLWPVDRFLSLIGRGSQCKLRLDHPEIPAVLACLIRTPASCWLINLSRHESVRVNDHPVLLESLDLGDALQLGAFHAELSAAPFLKTPRPVPRIESAPPIESKNAAAVRELATRHRQRLGALNKSLAGVQVYLDSEHLNAIPELKTALEQYILRAQRHHLEMQQALDRLSDG